MRTARGPFQAAVAVLFLCSVAPAVHAGSDSWSDREPIRDFSSWNLPFEFTPESGPVLHGNNGSPTTPTGVFDSPPVTVIDIFLPGRFRSGVPWRNLLDSPVTFLALDAGRVALDSLIVHDFDDFDDFGGFSLGPVASKGFVDSPAAGAIPAPGTLALLALAALTLRGRRRRR